MDGHLCTGRNFLLYRVRTQDAGRTEPCERSLLSPLHELCPAVSRQLSDVIDKALAFDYHDRYRRMLDFLDALEQVVRPEDYDIDLGH